MPNNALKKPKQHQFGYAKGGGGKAPKPPPPGEPVPPFFPDPDVFWPQTMDIWTGNGAVPPPAGGPRTSAVSIVLTGVWPEGHKTKVNANDAYTHIILCDPNVNILDPYMGNGQTLGKAFDALAIPAGQTNNWWLVVFSFVTNIPGLGRRRVILADRFGTPGSWTTLV